MPGLFVTATGTEVGKTYVTAALIRAARRARIPTNVLKPVMTGFDPGNVAQSDASVLLDALGLPMTPDSIDLISPWRFCAPLAPSMAAEAEGRRIDFTTLVTACRDALASECLTLIEGIGGVMVPLDEHRTVLDLIVALSLPVVLVTGSQLGALSHCLTALEVLRQRASAPALIVLNESSASTVPFDETQRTLAAFCTGTPVVAVPRNADAIAEDKLLKAVLPITGGRPGADVPPSRAGRTTA